MVYAIIRSGGKQQRVTVGDRIDVEKIPTEVGESLEINQVLAVGEGSDIQLGTPLVEGARVVCAVVRQDRARKILVGKYHKRKRYYRKNGHRQSFTRLRVDSIFAEGISLSLQEPTVETVEPEIVPVVTESIMDTAVEQDQN